MGGECHIYIYGPFCPLRGGAGVSAALSTGRGAGESRASRRRGLRHGGRGPRPADIIIILITIIIIAVIIITIMIIPTAPRIPPHHPSRREERRGVLSLVGWLLKPLSCSVARLLSVLSCALVK